MPVFTMCRCHETLREFKAGGHTYVLSALCKTCVRQTARPSSRRQNYFAEAPMVNNTCAEFMAREVADGQI